MEDILSNCYQFLKQTEWHKVALVSKRCYDAFKFMPKKLLHNQEEFYQACKKGHIEDIKFTLKQGNNFNWNLGLYGACRYGHKDIVQMMIDKGTNFWNWGLHGACEGGHEALIQMMIDKGANDWNWGLHGACQGGYKEIVQLMIENGAIREKHNWIHCKCLNIN